MIINSVTALNTFPNEELQINLNPINVTIARERLGIYFYSLVHDTGLQRFSLDTDYGVQSINSPFTTFTYPSCFTNIPDDFPVKWTVSACDSYLYGSFSADTSAFSVFPTCPYPIIERINTHEIRVSAGFLPYSFYDGLVTKDEYRLANVSPSLIPASDYSCQIICTSGYPAKHKNKFIASYLQNSTQNLNLNLSPNIVPESLAISFAAITATDAEATQVLSYADAVRLGYIYAFHTNWWWCRYGNCGPVVVPASVFPSEDEITNQLTKGITYSYTTWGNPDDNTKLVGRELEGLPPSITYPYIGSSSNINYNTGEVNIRTPNFIIPRNTGIEVTYDTRPVSSVSTNIVNISSISDNYYQLSAAEPIVYSNFVFVPSSTGPIPGVTYPEFTIKFIPQISVYSQTLSSIQISACMIDNFFQTESPITDGPDKIQIKFIERARDLTLSARSLNTNEVYGYNEWFPLSSHFEFFNDGMANNHTAVFEISTYRDSRYNNSFVDFILNKDKAAVYPVLSDITDINARLTVNIYPNYDPTLRVKWTADPPENITFIDNITQQNVLPDTLVPAGFLDWTVSNFGVERTILTIYSEEYDVSGTTTWFPSAGIWPNVYLMLDGVTDDYNKINYNELSALCVYRELNYRVPTNAAIAWKEVLDDSNGSFVLKNRERQTLQEDVLYPSLLRNSIIAPEISTVPTFSDPKLVSFNVNCHVLGPYYDLRTSKILGYRQFPANNFSISISGDEGTLRDSQNFRNSVFTTSANVLLTVNMSGISAQETDIYWATDNGFSTTGVSALLPLSSSFCVGVTAYDAIPYTGNFRYYNFNENTCLFLLTSLSPFDYISFPRYISAPTEQLTLANYSISSYGLTSYAAPCFTNYVEFSASAGFDTYIYTVHTRPLSSNSNIFSYPVNTSVLSAVSAVNISVKAFNQYFAEDDILTVYNSASADNSSIYKQKLSWTSLPTLSTSLTVNNPIFNIRQPRIPLALTLDLTPYDVTYSQFDIIVDDGIEPYTFQYEGAGSEIVYITNFTTDQTQPFSMLENNDTIFNVSLSGTALCKLYGTDMCPIEYTFQTNAVAFTAFDVIPALDIFTQKNLVSSTEVVTISTHFPAKPYYSYIFNDGLDNIYTFTNNITLTAIYSPVGFYSPSVTATNSIFNVVTEFTWDNFILSKDEFMEYDDQLTRQIPDKLVLANEDCRIRENDWQFADTFNTQITKLYENVDKLISDASVVDTNFPKLYLGWYGERNGVTKWRFDETYTNKYDAINFKNLRDICFYENKFVILRDNKIVISNDDQTLSTVFEITRIPDAELFTSPNKLLISNNRLGVLDTQLRKVFIFELNFAQSSVTLTHYWGGTGDRTSRTRLNNPTDFKADQDGNIYIVDADSKLIKVYNKHLNWTYHIDLTDYAIYDRPLSISFAEDKLLILTDNNRVVILANDLQIDDIIENINGSNVTLNPIDSYVFYTFDTDTLYYYYLNGTLIGSKQYNNIETIRSVAFHDGQMYIMCDDIILKAVDFIDTQSVLTEAATLSSWPLSSILVTPDETISDIVFNDSFEKLYNNINDVYSDITHKFVYNIDPAGAHISTEILPIQPNEIAPLSGLELLGANEIVSYETINRNFDILNNNIKSVKDMLDVRITYVTASNIIWTWEYHKLTHPQFPTSTRHPLSWEELMPSRSILNEAISGITWNNIAYSDPAVDNHFPISWVWSQMACQCIHPVSWEEMEIDFPTGRMDYTWEDLENNCSREPKEIFSNCIKIC
jgi:hypothetical protein